MDKYDSILVPPYLKPGDCIALIAPSSPFNETDFIKGKSWLSQRYQVLHQDGIELRVGYLAGSNERRIQELQWALQHPDVKAILAVRGGYGATRVAHLIDWNIVRKRPRWLIGFSDITALHVEAARVGVASIHGRMVCALANADEEQRQEWLATVEGTHNATMWTSLEVWNEGCADGVAFGGNLTLLATCAVAGRLRMPKHTILFLEDCNEQPYRIDRMLTSLIVGGYFQNVRGVVLGEFTNAAQNTHDITIEQALRDCLLPLNIPIVANAPLGHGNRNRSFQLGARVQLLATSQHRSVNFFTSF